MTPSHTFLPEEAETSGLPYSRPPLFSAQQPRVTAAEIIAEVAERNGLDVGEMLAHSRKERIAHPRQEAMYELRKRTRLSTSQIARRLGLTDHTTIIYGADKHAERAGLPVIRVRETGRAAHG